MLRKTSGDLASSPASLSPLSVRRRSGLSLLTVTPALHPALHPSPNSGTGELRLRDNCDLERDLERLVLDENDELEEDDERMIESVHYFKSSTEDKMSDYEVHRLKY